ncbi:MAG TPA: hypothetical protein VHK69_10780 [Chitinophagaceae bacterium]|jgi:hypothetical protein|nr:hypothetical protein [Chitinophagaceae bacterium]
MDPRDPNGRPKPPEEVTNQDTSLTNQDTSLTNQDASLVNNEQYPMDTQKMSDAATGVNDDNLTQTASDGETAPEYGDAADPAFEAM